MTKVRGMALFAAILIYGLWGSPTPEGFGPAEILVGVCLITAVTPAGGLRVLIPGPGPFWRKTAQVFLLYGMSMPVLTGLLHGNSPGGLVRDIIPFLFFLLPLFLLPLVRKETLYREALTVTVVMAGLFFALRVIWPYLGGEETFSDPLYLANAPTVLFAAVLLMGCAGLSLYERPDIKGFLIALACAALTLVPLVAMALVRQRAGIGVFVLGVVLLMAVAFFRKPYRALIPLICAGVALSFVWPVLEDTASVLLQKNTLVGLNMRGQEAAAVLRELDHSFWSVLFGRGWGATFASPAVGGVTVNFTHSLMTSFWLKTGLVGMTLALAYLGGLAKLFWPMIWRYPVMAVALAGPFLIDVFLYASFKSLDFGLILLLIAVWGYAHTPLNAYKNAIKTDKTTQAVPLPS